MTLADRLTARCATARAEGKHPHLIIMTSLDYARIVAPAQIKEPMRWYATQGGTAKQFPSLIGLPVLLSPAIEGGQFILVCLEDVPMRK